MEWSNEKALEFIELFQTEPCLWNPQLKGYKNRGVQNEAWRRIKRALPFPITVEDLKKKKESLMGYYRSHLNKYKKSLQCENGETEIYETNWYAFEHMDSFLRPIYINNSALNTGTTSDSTALSEAFEGQDDDPLRSSTPSTSHDPSSSSQDKIHPKSFQSNIKSTSQPHIVKREAPLEIIAAKKQMNEGFDCIKLTTSQNQKKEFDEYDHFGLMIAAKIRKMNDSLDREILMNAVQNLVFQSITKKKTLSSCGSSHDVSKDGHS